MNGAVGDRVFDFKGLVDLRRTLMPLLAAPGDPTWRLAPGELWRGTRTPEGPAALRVVRLGDERLSARAWGPGADWALSRVPDLLGMGDAEADLPAEELLPAAPNVLHRLARRARGVRLARSDRVVEMLVPIVLQQKVSGKEAARAHRNLVLTFSQPAPGPLGERGLWLPLAAERLRSLPGAALPPLGVSSRCAETLRRLGLHAGRLEEAASMPSDDAARRIGAVPGLGVWSVQSALLRGLGCADAVPVGDWNIPSAVAFTLSDGREQRADDARMLELLAPFVGQRGRVIRWVHAAGRLPPRRGPRMPLRPLPPVDGRLLGRLRR